MYVRWEQRPRSARVNSCAKEDAVLLVARLVTAQRVGGLPRQRAVAYLGAIGRWRLRFALPRDHFWADAERRLAPLGLDEATRTRVLAALGRVVPRPDPEAVARERASLGM